MYTRANLFKLKEYVNDQYVGDALITVNRPTYPTTKNVEDYVVVEGDNIFSIAYRFLGDHRLFYKILDHNVYVNSPVDVVPGMLLRIPR